MDREKDIQELCRQVLETPAGLWDNPNGQYESRCLFCDSVYESREPVSINEISHNLNCAYLIAKDLSTNYQSK